MNLPFRKNPWPLMLAVNVALLTGVFLNTITMQPYLYLPYIHLLVDYHFGFTKRALIGAVVSLFTDKIPVWLVFALGGGVWLITAVLFIWFLWSIWFLWFDERNKPDRPDKPDQPDEPASRCAFPAGRALLALCPTDQTNLLLLHPAPCLPHRYQLVAAPSSVRGGLTVWLD